MAGIRRTAAGAGDDVVPIIEFCVRGPPVTSQVRGPKGRDRLRDWKERVAQAARSQLPAGYRVTSDDLEVCLSEFSETRTIDRDNMAKPMLDAMQGIVYVNDRQVHLRSEWCNINGRFRIRHMSTVVAAAMSSGHEFVWVKIATHRQREVLR